MAADTRGKILEAALELFRERGFDESTMREIAARAGVATGLAYYYFASKDAIVLAFYQRAKDDLAAKSDAAHGDKRLGPRLQSLIDRRVPHSRLSLFKTDSGARSQAWRTALFDTASTSPCAIDVFVA